MIRSICGIGEICGSYFGVAVSAGRGHSATAKEKQPQITPITQIAWRLI
jgi:hypothetical protein